MAEAKQKFIQTRIPLGVLAWFYLYSPDDKAPEGASWKPDGKYKATAVFEPGKLDALETLIKTEAALHFAGEIDWENFRLPYTLHDEDSPRENWRNKIVLKASTKTQPNVFDAKKVRLSPVLDSAGNPVMVNGKPAQPSVMLRSGDIVNLLVSFYFFEKTEKVKEGKKLVDVTVRGLSLRLAGVQLIDKRASGGGDDGFDEEDGYSAGTGSTASTTNGTAGDDDGNGDF